MGSYDEEAIGPHLRALRVEPRDISAGSARRHGLGSVDLQALLKRRPRPGRAGDGRRYGSGPARRRLRTASWWPRAALGIEEEVRQGVRVRIGEGFAGRVAAAKRPLFLDQVDETTVSNPILWRRGDPDHARGSPHVGGRVIGVLHVGSLSARPFDERDAAVLGLIADRVGAEVQMRLLDADRDAAEALQRSLVPSVPSDDRRLRVRGPLRARRARRHRR